MDKSQLELLLKEILRGSKAVVRYDKAHTKLMSFLYENKVLDLTEKTMILFPGGLCSLNYYTLSNWLINRARQAGISEAISNLFSFQEASGFYVSYFHLIDGIEIQKKIQLSEDSSLIPSAELNRELNALSISDEYKIKLQSGSTILVSHYSIKKLIVDDEGDNEQKSWEKVERLQDSNYPVEIKNNFLLVVMQALTLIEKVAPAIVCSAHVVSPSIPVIGGFRLGSQSDWKDSDRGYLLQEGDVKELRRLIELFNQLKEKQREKLSISLERLLRAKGGGIPQYDHLSKFIDLGIASEGLLLSDSQEDMTEITFKICVRVARLLGKSLEERKEIYKVFQTLYALRSVAVHTGSLNLQDESRLDFIEKKYSLPLTSDKRRKVAELATEYLIEVAKIALDKYVKTSKAIDWKEVVLA